MNDYSIKDIIDFRKIDWNYSEDFLFLANIPPSFEDFTIMPDYFSYGMITKGNLVVELDGELLEINNKNRSFLLYRPHQNLKITHVTPGTQGFFILFNKQFIQTLDKDYLSITEKTFLESRYDSYYLLKDKDYKHLRSVFSKIFNLLSFIKSDLWSQKAKNLLLVLISETDTILKKYQLSKQAIPFNRSQQLLESFIKLVSEHYQKEQHLCFYAQSLKLGKNK